MPLPGPKSIFLDENKVVNLRGGGLGIGVGAAAALPGGRLVNNQFQIGVNNVDTGAVIEKVLTLPWAVDPLTSWHSYQNWIEVFLDPGVVVHKTLPQSSSDIDTLASVYVDDVAVTTSKARENLVSNGTWTDFIQQMATSEYTFVLKGFGMRFGYTIPVPGLRTVAGVPAIPGKQWSLGNPIVGNFSGVPLYYNKWRLEYTVSIPPTAQQPSPPNVAMHIGGQAPLPSADGAIYSQADSKARQSGPPGRIG